MCLSKLVINKVGQNESNGLYFLAGRDVGVRRRAFGFLESSARRVDEEDMDVAEAITVGGITQVGRGLLFIHT